ncbi:MAG: metallophosphoesterase family protein [Gaiellaceae bacterium]
MRTALVSDVHGNAVGLEAVLADLARVPVDQVVALGDMVQGGPHPAEVVDRIAELGWPVVLGNADAFLLDPDAGSEPASEPQLEARAWSVAQLGPERLEVLRGFVPTVTAPLGGGRTLLAFHGSPTSFDDFLFPETPEGVFRQLVAEADADVLAGGHIHLQFVRRLGDAFFVNPGSAGLSYDHEQAGDGFRADPWAAYAIVEVREGGLVEVAFRRVPFDAESVAAAVIASGMPHAEATAERWQAR